MRRAPARANGLSRAIRIRADVLHVVYGKRAKPRTRVERATRVEGFAAMSSPIFDQVSLQDRDLLLRLGLYFDQLNQRVRTGEGWLIFNAAPRRSSRISSYVHQRLKESDPPLTYTIMGWRDFSLSAYIQHEGIPDRVIPAPADERLKHETEVARTVTRRTLAAMTGSDFLVLTGLKPSHLHEAVFLDWLVERRYERKLPTMLVTPDLPQQLEAELASVDPTRTCWDRLFTRMYETSLVAL